MKPQHYTVVTEAAGKRSEHEIEAYTPQMACRAAEAQRRTVSGAGAVDVLHVSTTWQIVARCENCKSVIFDNEDWHRRRGQVRCFAC